MASDEEKMGHVSFDPLALKSMSSSEPSEEMIKRVEGLIREEIYENQVLGVTCSSIHTEVMDFFSEVVNNVMEDTKKKLSKKYKLEDAEEVTNQLGTSYIKRFQEHSKDLTKAIKNLVGLPADYLPPIHSGNEVTLTAEYEKEVDQMLENELNKFRANCVMVRTLKSAIKRWKRIGMPKETSESIRHLRRLKAELALKEQSLEEWKAEMAVEEASFLSKEKEEERNEAALFSTNTQSDSDSGDDDF